MLLEMSSTRTQIIQLNGFQISIEPKTYTTESIRCIFTNFSHWNEKQQYPAIKLHYLLLSCV